MWRCAALWAHWQHVRSRSATPLRHSAGVALDIQQKYRFDLTYTGYYGNIATDPATGAMTVPNGLPASLSDRGWVSLTFKMTF